MKRLIISAICIAFFILALAPNLKSQNFQNTLTEKEKIEILIKSVEDLHDAKFYRNGSLNDSKTAAEHLRMKVDKAGYRIKTAEDFIEKVASESYLSGEAYKIIYSGGKEITSKEFFYKKLKELNNPK